MVPIKRTNRILRTQIFLLQDENTALIFATERDDGIAELLLEHGADCFKRDEVHDNILRCIFYLPANATCNLYDRSAPLHSCLHVAEGKITR